MSSLNFPFHNFQSINKTPLSKPHQNRLLIKIVVRKRRQIYSQYEFWEWKSNQESFNDFWFFRFRKHTILTLKFAFNYDVILLCVRLSGKVVKIMSQKSFFMVRNNKVIRHVPRVGAALKKENFRLIKSIKWLQKKTTSVPKWHHSSCRRRKKKRFYFLFISRECENEFPIKRNCLLKIICYALVGIFSFIQTLIISHSLLGALLLLKRRFCLFEDV